MQHLMQVEVIVVDGGSQDDTVPLAESFGLKVICTQPGRARQMNQGAAAATGDMLLFLHADTCLPDQWDQQVRETLARPGVVAGAFNLRINGSGVGLRLVEWGVGLRSHLFQMPYGDQAIFLPAPVFEQLGGFPELPIMEDFELMRRLRRKGQIAIADTFVQTSNRRWQKLGVWRTTLMNQLMIAGYFGGIEPEKLSQWYRRGHQAHKQQH